MFIKAKISPRKLSVYQALKSTKKNINHTSTYPDFCDYLTEFRAGYRYSTLVCVRFLNHDTGEKHEPFKEIRHKDAYNYQGHGYYHLPLIDDGVSYFHLLLPSFQKDHTTENKTGQHPDIQRDVRTRRIFYLNELSTALKTRLTLFRSNWSLVFDPIPEDREFVANIKKLQGGLELDCDLTEMREIVFPYCIKQCQSIIKDAETHLNKHLKPFMAQQLPTIEKLDHFIEKMIDVERGYGEKYNQLTAHYENQQNVSLKALQEEYDQKLETMRAETNQKLIEMHQTIGKQQELIDQLQTMNQMILESQKGKAGEYESQLLNLLAKLKDE